MNELREELDSVVAEVVKNFAGKKIDQDLVAGVWTATLDEIINFCDQKLKLSMPTIEYIHAYYINTAIKIGTATGQYTIGQLTTQDKPPLLESVPLVDLCAIRQVFENTVLENVIVAEIEHRLKDGSTKEQDSRSN